YQTLTSYVGIASVGSEIFPTIDHILSEYLTLQILSAECIEIAQCLYFNAILVDQTMIGLDSDNDNIDIVFANNDTNQAQNQITPTIPINPRPLTILCSVALSNKYAAARYSKFGEIWAIKADPKPNDTKPSLRKHLVSRTLVVVVVKLGTIVQDIRKKVIDISVV
ncbi:23012_t:CDS:2, partial [Racocetra persica]